MSIKPVSIEELRKYPKMTSWFSPTLLSKLLWRVVVSEYFGQYADRRLIVAALDPVKKEELWDRARGFYPKSDLTNPEFRRPTQFEPIDGAIWVDFVADLGDGFDPTYAVASLLAKDQLKLKNYEKPLPRGQMLVMGGDEVYPNADVDFYTKQTFQPYGWAFPDLAPKDLHGPPVFAIPGNHDWYDGLVLFLAYFTREKPHTHVGGWRAWQRRSYFAVQLTEKWWIWGMDAQLADDVDQPQKDYFEAIAEKLVPDSKVILCGPEPGWLYTLQANNKSLSVIDNIAWSAHRHKADIPIVLSGDTHHYSRYSGNDGTQFITSGGGGAFLHPTHQLQNKVALDRSTQNREWLAGKASTLNLTSAPDGNHTDNGIESCFPTKTESLELLKGSFKFGRLNPEFCKLLGVIYFLSAGLTLGLFPDSLVLIPALFFLGFWGYTKRQEGNSRKVAWVSLCNAVVHSGLAIGAALIFLRLNAHLPDFFGWRIPSLLIWLIEMSAVGTIIGGYLFGVYLYYTSKLAWLNLNHNDAFSSMRLESYKNFLRIRITDEEVQIFPIGLKDVPARSQWKFNDKQTPSNPSVYIPEIELEPHLIEGPIVIRASTPPSQDTAPKLSPN